MTDAEIAVMVNVRRDKYTAAPRASNGSLKPVQYDPRVPVVGRQTLRCGFDNTHTHMIYLNV